MEKVSGKDYFGFLGGSQADSYSKYRPQYPEALLSSIFDGSLKDLNRDVCIDIATGTGFLASHFSKQFKLVIGSDISDAQLQKAVEAHQDKPNISFKNFDVLEISQFLKNEGLEGKVDLISIGQGLHWLDFDKTLTEINSVLRQDSKFAVFAYSIPLIYDGSNMEKQIASKKLDEVGFEIVTNPPAGYTFKHDREVCEKLSSAYQNMWSIIYPHFRCNRSAIEEFFTSWKFSDFMTVERKVVWYDFTPDKDIGEVIGYMNSASAYHCYLEDKKIAKGSPDDPLVQLAQTFAQYKTDKIDFVTPYFVYILGKKY